MKTMSIAAAAAGLILSAGVAIPAAWAADGPPANLRPATVYGVGLAVVDLEGQRAWYAAKLGMTLSGTTKAADGSPSTYFMALGASTTTVALTKWPADQPRPKPKAWFFLGVPNAKGLADWLKTQGVDNVQVLANVSYSITDPEGNAVVLYTPMLATVAAAPATVPVPSSRCGSGPTRSRLLDAALRMMADASPYEYETAQDMYKQGLAQQSIFDEQYANCLRSIPTP